MSRTSRAWIIYVRRRTLKPCGGLVHEDATVRKHRALALAAAGQQERADRHRRPEAERLDLALDVLQRVVDGEPRVERPSRSVDIQRDHCLRVIGIEVQELGDREVGDLLLDRLAQEDDPLP